jgi:hypothetical protein
VNVRERKRLVEVNGFQIRFEDARGQRVELSIQRDHHAEQILRGLVHSGFEVSIKEVPMTISVNYDECCEAPTALVRPCNG